MIFRKKTPEKRRLKVKGLFFLLFAGMLIFTIHMQLTSCSNAPGRKSDKDSTDKKDTVAALADSIKSLYNYELKKKPYKLTFLEFGSKNCIPCKMMELVLDSVRYNYGKEVNVVFYDVREKKNKKMLEHFGIELIPVQVLLDRNGIEYYRHIGYLPYDSLVIKFNKHLDL